MESFSLDKAKELLNGGIGKAQDLLKDTPKVDALLEEVEEKLKSVPTVGTTLADVPLMISMVKSYITQEYTEVSPKVVASLVASFLYLVKRKDIIPDNLPLVGQLDDIAVAAVALKVCGPELKAYADWRDKKDNA